MVGGEEYRYRIKVRIPIRIDIKIEVGNLWRRARLRAGNVQAADGGGRGEQSYEPAAVKESD